MTVFPAKWYKEKFDGAGKVVSCQATIQDTALPCSLPVMDPEGRVRRLFEGWAAAYHEPNCAIVGTSAPETVLVWRRPPGRMKLAVVSMAYQIAMGSEVEVAAGRSYSVNLTSADGVFHMKDR